MDKHEEELRMIAEEGKKKRKMEIKNVDIIRLKQELGIYKWEKLDAFVLNGSQALSM